VHVLFHQGKKGTALSEKQGAFLENIRKVDGQLRLYLAVVFLFTLGNSSNAFIILKANAVGFDTISVILLYFIYNILILFMKATPTNVCKCLRR